MRKLEFLPSTVSVNLSVVALPIVPKVEFIFQIMLYIVIFLYESTGSCFNLWSVIKTHLKAHRSFCFRGGRRKVNFFTRKVWWLATPWSSILRQPKHWFVFCLEVPIKEVIYLFGPQRAMITQRTKSETCHSTIWCNWWRNEEKRWTFFRRTSKNFVSML